MKKPLLALLGLAGACAACCAAPLLAPLLAGLVAAGVMAPIGGAALAAAALVVVVAGVAVWRLRKRQACNAQQAGLACHTAPGTGCGCARAK